MSPSMEARIAEYAALPTPLLPPPSPLSPWSSPLPQIPPPPLPPPTADSLTYAEALLGYRAAGIRIRASSPPVPASLPLPSSPLPPSLFIPPVDRREDIPEDELPPRKRLCSTALTLRYEVGESSIAAPRPTRGHRVDYGFIGTLNAETRRQRAEAVGYGIRDTWEQDTQDIYAVIEDTQDRQTRIFQSVKALVDDRHYHYETARLLDQEALVSQEAWAHSESLIATLVAQVSSLQGHLATALGEIRALQARDQTRADAPEGAASTNNMPTKRTSAAARTAAAAAAPMTAAVVEQLMAERVSATLANH
ncbi:hypothetical protein Tco_0143891 [Tanacetum coccineum]